MDLAVILPLTVLLVLQTLISLALLSPRALSKHAAALMALTKTNVTCQAVAYTLAGGVVAMAASSALQLFGVVNLMKANNVFGDR